MNMNSVGIDVSKGKSMVAVMRPFGEVVVSPFEVRHTDSELSKLAKLLKSLDGETRVVMEATGNYHTPVAWLLHDAGLYVSVVNAMLVHDYGNNSLRRAKTDKKDAVKLANYGPLAHAAEVRPGGRYPAGVEELLPAVPAVFQGANHVEKQPDLFAGYRFSWCKPSVYKPSPHRWQREVGGFCSRLLALRVREYAV
jgi:hypothetical protein